MPGAYAPFTGLWWSGGDLSDARAMQVDTALAAIEKKLCKAHNRINKHDWRHSNPFLAYFDLRGKTDA